MTDRHDPTFHVCPSCGVGLRTVMQEPSRDAEGTDRPTQTHQRQPQAETLFAGLPQRVAGKLPILAVPRDGGGDACGFRSFARWRCGQD